MEDNLFPELAPNDRDMEIKTLKEIILLLENQTRLLKKEIETNSFAISQLKGLLEGKGI